MLAMDSRHTRWIGLAASTAALLCGGPVAALAGLLGSKHLVKFPMECLGRMSLPNLSTRRTLISLRVE